MPTLSRRALLEGAAAAAAAALPGAAAAGLGGCGGAPPAPPPAPGAVLGGARMARGHRVWAPLQHAPEGIQDGDEVDVLIVGAGVAGLAAAWRLRRAGFPGSVAIVELADRIGGTATWGEGERGPYALGAHYVTMPNPENLPMRRLLHALGVITGFAGVPASGPGPLAGRPRYDPAHLCLAPQERLWVGGAWSDGLWPAVASAEDDAQKAAFDAVVARLAAAVGADGRPAFSIPTARASHDPRFRSLAARSFADWLDAQGLTSPVLRWWLEYGTRDDYGTTLAQTSAWAGLHYHCARRPDPADDRDLGTHVLTWPAGNGWLVQGLARLAETPVSTGQLVRAIDPETGHCAIEDAAGALRGLRAGHVVLAVPAPVRARLVGAPTDPAVPLPTAAPWRVAALQVSALPAGRGVGLAWDSVVYGNPDLGYISSAHQSARYGGPTVLTWYEALTGDPRSARAPLVGARYEDERDHVLAALLPAHPDLPAVLERLDIWHWGHGTVRPTVGLHTSAAGVAALAPLARPQGRVIAAHTDLSGLSLFEEALWHGISAAEWVLAERGLGGPSWQESTAL